ncbi:hypothetical protein [Demequina salsinemoris]|uniref:hypothetical protein n=1 Tax=Demequina salsinemoris TaxID=577470 RepID=UPI00128B316A|nr:hypothetical protein [Demequina salsinemoris]
MGADVPFTSIVGLYDEQVPGCTDGITEDAQWREVVYELTLESAKVDAWDEHAVVHLADEDAPDPDVSEAPHSRERDREPSPARASRVPG